MQKFKCVIFDLDGVLTETSKQHFKAWSMLFEIHFKIWLDPNLETLTRGVSRMDSLSVLLKHYQLHQTMSTQKLESLAHEKNEMYKKAIEDMTKKDLFEGVLSLLNHLKKHDIKIALGSASKNGVSIIHKLEIDQYFDYIVDPSVLKGKPEPDIFLDASNHFGYLPSDCVGIEDAEAGVRAIKRAQMYAIGVGSEVLKDADLKFKHIKDIPHKLFTKS